MANEGSAGTVSKTLNGLLGSSGKLGVPDTVLCPVRAGTANEPFEVTVLPKALNVGVAIMAP